MRVKARQKMHNCQSRKLLPAREPRPRRSPGLKLRSRRSLTMPCSWTTSSTRECLRNCQRSSASPELLFARSLKLVAQSQELSSRTCTGSNWSSQSDNSTLNSTCSWEIRLRPPLRKRPKIRLLRPRRRSDLAKFLINCLGFCTPIPWPLHNIVSFSIYFLWFPFLYD